MLKQRICRPFPVLVVLLGSCLLFGRLASAGFVPPARSASNSIRTRPPAARNFLDEETENETVRKRSFVMSPEQVKPIFRMKKGEKEKVVNAFGLRVLAVSLITCPLWAAAMALLDVVDRLSGGSFDPDRDIYDATGKMWSKAWLAMTDSFPTFSGDVDRINEDRGQACLYVANHASWLDIPVICTVLDPVFKFIAKGELRNFPCIGQQLVGVSRLAVHRNTTISLA